jgi:hypothetical protein
VWNIQEICRVELLRITPSGNKTVIVLIASGIFGGQAVSARFTVHGGLCPVSTTGANDLPSLSHFPSFLSLTFAHPPLYWH